MTGWLILAQGDSVGVGVGSGAGWVGAGLLGMVLGWVFMRLLPDKDRQTKEYIDAKDAAIKDLLDRWGKERQEERLLRHEQAKQFKEAITESQLKNDEEARQSRQEFREALQAIIVHCEKETAKMGEAVRQEIRLAQQQVQASLEKQAS